MESSEAIGKSRTQIPQKVIATAKDYIAAKVVLFSACQDNQKTAGIDNVRKLRLSFVPEDIKGGACTSLFLQVLYHHHKLQREYQRRLRSNPGIDNGLTKSISVERPPPMTYGKILSHMQEVCERNRYVQVPLLSSSRPLQMHKDPFQIVPDNFRKNTQCGIKRALIIGINYTDTLYALPGCQNDCRNVMAFLKQVHGFEDAHITLLLDDPIACDELHQPTKENILRAFRKFSMQCQEGDVVFIHYAGHGVAVPDQSGDEADGFDEALMPVDYATAGEIVDDEIFRLLLIPMPKNVVVTALFDCCHSGTIMDLPFEYSIAQPDCDYNSVSFPHMHMVDEFRNRVKSVKEKQDLHDVRGKSGSPSSPKKHCPRGRSQTTTPMKRRMSKSMEPSLCRRKPLIPDKKRVDKSKQTRQHPKPKSLQTKNFNTIHKPQGDKIASRSSPPSLKHVWKKVVSGSIGRPPKTPTKIKKTIGVTESNPMPSATPLSPKRGARGGSKEKADHVVPRDSPRRERKQYRSRSPRRRSQSQPVPQKMSKRDTEQAATSRSPNRKLNFQKLFKPSSHGVTLPNLLKGRDSRKETRSPEACRHRRRPKKQNTKRSSKSMPPAKDRKYTEQSTSPKRVTKQRHVAFHQSPRSPKNGRRATTFGSPRPTISPPRIIEIPVL